MEFKILGPLEVTEQGRSLPLGGRKPRALLALLLLRHGRVRSVDELIEGSGATRHRAVPITVSRCTSQSYGSCWSMATASRSRGESPATSWRSPPTPSISTVSSASANVAGPPWPRTSPPKLAPR